MVGPDNAGKTAILERMVTGEFVETTPTIGLNMNTVSLNNTQVLLFDLAGRPEFEPFLFLPFPGACGMIFVVDATDDGQLDRASTMLQNCANVLSPGTPIVFFANKQDLPNTISNTEITDRLHLDGLQSHPTHIQETCALSGQGLFEGLNWLLERVPESQQQ